MAQVGQGRAAGGGFGEGPAALGSSAKLDKSGFSHALLVQGLGGGCAMSTAWMSLTHDYHSKCNLAVSIALAVPWVNPSRGTTVGGQGSREAVSGCE